MHHEFDSFQGNPGHPARYTCATWRVNSDETRSSKSNPQLSNERRSDPSIPPCVLIVDDDSMSRELMKEALEPLEYRLLEASDGLEALDILEKDRVDVMLVDVQMPHLDGFGFLSRVRQMDAFANIPIVAVTAYAVGIDRSRLSGHDFDQYLSKPVPVSTLRQVVRTMLESSGSDSRN